MLWPFGVCVASWWWWPILQGYRPIAVFDVESKYVPNKPLEALKCYGTSSLEHPGTQMIAMERGKYYLGGKITGE